MRGALKPLLVLAASVFATAALAQANIGGGLNVPSTAGVGSGTVTQVVCGSGLNGGTITTSGTCSLANPSATTLGGVESLAAATHQFIVAISTSGVPSAARPACADLSDATAFCNLSATGGVTAAMLASGVAASNLGYTPAQSGANTDITSQTSVTIAGTAGAGYEQFGAQSATPTSPAANTVRVFADASGNLDTVNSSGTVSVFTQRGNTTVGTGSIVLSAGGLSVASGKTLTVSNSITLAGTDGTTMTFPATSQTIPGLNASNVFTALNNFTGTLKVANITNSTSAHIVDAATAPTISSGFGASPTLNQNGSFAFTVAIGSSPGTTGVVAMNTTAASGWICLATDFTTPSEQVRETTYSATAPGFTFYNWAGTPTAPNAADVVGVTCRAN